MTVIPPRPKLFILNNEAELRQYTPEELLWNAFYMPSKSSFVSVVGSHVIGKSGRIISFPCRQGRCGWGSGSFDYMPPRLPLADAVEYYRSVWDDARVTSTVRLVVSSTDEGFARALRLNVDSARRSRTIHSVELQFVKGKLHNCTLQLVCGYGSRVSAYGSSDGTLRYLLPACIDERFLDAYHAARLTDTIIALLPLQLPAYVLLWILDLSCEWLAFGLPELRKITLIQGLINSRRHVLASHDARRLRVPQ